MMMGIDEVGRGAWAGPLVAGAVILDQPILELTDSKLLSKTRRVKLSQEIKQQAISYGLGCASPEEIDELGLTIATGLAIQRARQGMVDCDEIIIDGCVNFLPGETNVKTIIKADSSVPAVAAASIIAKVARDEYMADQASKYRNYGFDSHVGYGTAQHKLALIAHGLTPLHRRSYKPIQVFA